MDQMRMFVLFILIEKSNLIFSSKRKLIELLRLNELFLFYQN